MALNAPCCAILLPRRIKPVRTIQNGTGDAYVHSTARREQTTEHTEMKDRFPAAKANTAISEITTSSLASLRAAGYDDGNFISHFEYAFSRTGRDSQER